MKFFGPNHDERIAQALEGLLALYKRDLEDRGVVLTFGENKEEGETYVTDDATVAALLERLQLNRPRDHAERGLYIGDAPGGGIPAPEEGQTTEIGVTPEGRFGPVLFGSNWGLNRGPEGAEESWTGSDSNGSPGIPTSGDVLKQGSSA
jgi:hypothetical protein